MARRISSPRRSLRTFLHLEELETRLALSPVEPTPIEQEFLQRLNAARANPAAYGQSIGLDLSNVAPSQPLAFSSLLGDAALGHSQDMNINNYFDHNSLTGLDPGARITAAGFLWTSWGESIAAGYTTPEDALKGLIIDAGVPDLGHRMHLLAMTPTFQAQEQVGVGIVLNGTGTYHDYYTIDSAATTDTRPFLTGVVFKDLNANGLYDAGEGLGGVTITVAGVGSTTTWGSGGYNFQLSPGTYTVTASGGGLAAPVTTTVSVGAKNVEVDFTPAAAAGGGGGSTGGGSTGGGSTGGGTTTSGTPAHLGNVSTILTHSTENLTTFVTTTYQSFLKRGPDAGGLNYWVNGLATGALNDQQLEASFIGSAEYIQDHGGTNGAWVNSMYTDLLGRAPQAFETNYWVSQLAAGASPAGVAYGFAASAEREGIHISAIYQAFLNRAPASSETGFWVTQFGQGASNETIEASLLSSLEYYTARAHNDIGTWVGNAYQLVLHRAATATDVAFWASQAQ